jgi:hypothetical protein
MEELWANYLSQQREEAAHPGARTSEAKRTVAQHAVPVTTSKGLKDTQRFLPTCQQTLPKDTTTPQQEVANVPHCDLATSTTDVPKNTKSALNRQYRQQLRSEIDELRSCFTEREIAQLLESLGSADTEVQTELKDAEQAQTQNESAVIEVTCPLMLPHC